MQLNVRRRSENGKLKLISKGSIKLKSKDSFSLSRNIEELAEAHECTMPTQDSGANVIIPKTFGFTTATIETTQEKAKPRRPRRNVSSKEKLKRSQTMPICRQPIQI